MTHWLAFALVPVVAIPIGLVLGLAVMQRVRQSKRFRIGALVAASLFSFVTYRDPGERARVEETEAETKRKKEKGVGDPPALEASDLPEQSSLPPKQCAP